MTIDTSKIAILNFDVTRFLVFKDGKPTDLTIDDLQKIETILNECITIYNSEQEKRFNEIKAQNPVYKLEKENFIIDLQHYKRQYEPVLNSKGEKEVWVNCFCDTHNSDWRNERVVVKDGGNCYFNLKINLTKGHYYELKVNRDA
ncbi:MAG: hypothetical protein ACK40M_02360 [Flavobacteriales bacterium]